MTDWNVLQWDGAAGHYEVYYLSATDPKTGTGLWIRYTMRAPTEAPGECHLWFMAMRPDGHRFARKKTFPVDQLVASTDPFRLEIAGSVLSDEGMTGGFDDVSWDLHWAPTLPPAEHVNGFLRRAKIAKTVLVLPHPDLAVSGTVRYGDTELELDAIAGGQAHLWGSKHALRWAWVHCNDFDGHDETYVDAVSVFVPRFGREIGPNTPVVGRFLGEDFRSTDPLRVLRNASTFDLESWSFEAVDGNRKIVAQVDAPRQSLVGVTYDDPDGDNVWCYNSEASAMRLEIHDKHGRSWTLRDTLVTDGGAHFEYAQRTPVSDVELLIT
jgi:hypothetical protein